MPTFYGNSTRGLAAIPARQLGGDGDYGGRLRRYRAVIALDAPASGETTNGTVIANGDDVILARVPANSVFAFGVITSSVSLGSSTVSVGVTGAVGKYRAAATFTATATPTFFGVTAAVAAAPLGAEETIRLYVTTANLPNTAGAQLVVDLYFSAP